MYQALVFDLDGTLLDTAEDLANAVNHALSVTGYPTRTLDEVRRFTGNGMRRLVSLSSGLAQDDPRFDSVFSAFREHYASHAMDNTHPYTGVAELLDDLHRRGVRIAVVTNKMQASAEALIHALFPSVDVVIGERPNLRKKPAPDGVLLALETLGVEKRNAAYIGDSEVDCETAKNAGLPCLSVLWGFRTKEELIAAGATDFYDTPAAILAKLTR